MNVGMFLDSIKRSGDFLKSIDLVKDSLNPKNLRHKPEKYTEEFRKVALKDEYFDMYRVGLENSDYDFLLLDDSFFQYTYQTDKNIIRMAFYPNPNILTYQEFLTEYCDTDYSSAGEIYIDYYEQFLSEQTPLHVTPIRYDYDESLYISLVHHVSHLHFGISNDIRIGANRILTPLAFTKIILNYYYYDIWKKRLANDTTFRNDILSVKLSCCSLADEFFNEDEKLYFYIG